MKIRLLLLLAFVTFIFHPARAYDPDASFTGHYELADDKAVRGFSLDIKQTDDKADISFLAAAGDAAGIAPDGEGKGTIKKAVLTFTFKDSFDNEGKGRLIATSHDWQLRLEVTKVVDSRCLPLYSDLRLKRTSTKPQE